MHSEFHLFGLNLPGYGLMISTGILVVWLIGANLGNRFRIGPDMSTSVLTAALLGGFLGGKALAVLTEWDYYGKDLSRIISASQGGVAYGAIIGGLIAVAIYGRAKRFFILDVLDVGAFLICTGQIFGRLGCFMAGCCYGRPAEWGVHFPKPSIAYKTLRHTSIPGIDTRLTEGEQTVALIPTQLIESGAMVLLATLLFVLLLKKTRRGLVLFTYLGVYAAFRFTIEFWRMDPERGFLFDGLLSTSQFIACIMAIISIIGLLVILLRPPKTPT